MGRTEFLATYRIERAKLDALLVAVGIDHMDTVGVSGVYSVKDVVAHLEAYDRALITWLNEAQAGRIYVDPVVDQPDLDVRNAIVWEANKGRSATDVVAAFRRTQDELEAAIEKLSDDELTNVDSTAWFVEPRWQRRQELWKCIAGDSFEHYRQHVPDIERWLRGISRPE